MTSPGRRLRDLMALDTPVLAPLVFDPISAKLAESAGFRAMYLGGGSMGYLNTATEANLTLTEMAQAALQIRAVSDLPLILDGTCGWGDPMHLHRTIAMSEAAGFAAIEIEDQLVPKRAHHHVDVEHLIPAELMTHKIEEAVAARRHPDFIIIARTNACRTHGLDEALHRAEAYRRAGADMLLILPRSPEQARDIGERLEGPLFYLMLGSVTSIGMSLAELGDLGYKIVVDPVTPFLAHHKALRLSYEALAKSLPDPTLGADYREEGLLVHRTIELEKLLDVERRTVELPRS